MTRKNEIRISQAYSEDAREAVAAFHSEVAQPDMELVIFFCSSFYDLDALATEMRRLFAGVQVVGCTAAGEIGPAGCRRYSLSGASFPADSFKAVSGLIGELQCFDADRGYAFSQALLQRLEAKASGSGPETRFAFLMIDGMSLREERVTHILQGALGRIPLVGGSAGDDMRFTETYVYCDGRFHPDSAVAVLIDTRMPFRAFKTQHFVATDKRVVVTRAEPDRRTVNEIDGLPAAEAYAALLGVEVRELDATHFAAFPLMVRIGGVDFVRSIQKAGPDGSLTFYCAIDEGLVLRLAHGVNLLENMVATFEDLKTKIGAPQVMLGCDCILRGLEMEKQGVGDRVGELFRRNRFVGYNSYGEQFCGIHVNQTLTGIAIGSRPGGADG